MPKEAKANAVLESNPKTARFIELKKLKSEATALSYAQNIRRVLGENSDSFLTISKESREEHLERWILENSKVVSASSLGSYLAGTKAFLDYYEALVNWKKINTILPKGRPYANDRVPTIEELRHVLKVADPRMRVVILLLSSGGMRVGALEGLTLKHFSRKGKIGIVKVYAGTNEQYTTFLTSECLDAIDYYLNLREMHGEKLNPGTPLIRNVYEVGNVASVSNVQRVNMRLISVLMWKLWNKIGLREVSSDHYKRQEFSSCHSLRKWFKTRMENSGAKSIVVEQLLGHGTGLNANYYRPSEDEMLKEYAAHLQALFIDEKYHLSTELEVQHAQFTSKMDEMKEAMGAMKERIDSLSRLAVNSEEANRTADEMRQLWSMIDSMKGKLRAMEEERMKSSQAPEIEKG